MIIIITGASHTGKTMLAQRFLCAYNISYLSIDLLKMGLIRSGTTQLTPYDDCDLEAYLWPIICEIIKTAIENKQSIIIEGVYIPFNWNASFTETYLKEITYYCLIMSERYIAEHFQDIKFYANVIEQRLDDSQFSVEEALQENMKNLQMCMTYQCNYILIDDVYALHNIDLNKITSIHFT